MIHLRPATLRDGRMILRWRNEPSIVRQCLHPRIIPAAEHLKWFHSRLKDPRTRIYILQDSQGTDVGQGRIDLRRGMAEISLSLRRSSRGRGLGCAAIESLTRHALRSGARKVIARIKMDNPASVIAFIKAGFNFLRCSKAAGQLVYLMEKPR